MKGSLQGHEIESRKHRLIWHKTLKEFILVCYRKHALILHVKVPLPLLLWLRAVSWGRGLISALLTLTTLANASTAQPRAKLPVQSFLPLENVCLVMTWNCSFRGSSFAILMISNVQFRNIKYIHNVSNHYQYSIPKLVHHPKQKLYPFNNYFPFTLPVALGSLYFTFWLY